MNNLNYSSSEDDLENGVEFVQKTTITKKRIPRLPDFFEENVEVNKTTGQIRNYKHIKGNWSTLIFLKVPLEENVEKVISQINTNVRKTNAVKRLKIPPFKATTKPSENFLHISISRNLILKKFKIEILVKKLEAKLKTLIDTFSYSQFNGFFIGFNELECFLNEEKNRIFVSLKVGAGHDYVKLLTDSVNEVLKELNFKEFYEDPQFHCSFCWNVIPLEQQVMAKEDVLDLLLFFKNYLDIKERKHLNNLLNEKIFVGKVYVSSGNEMYEIELS
ncbi:poly(U)-specific 3'-to-5' RNA exonuclease [Lobulomyces angularis]|nr:poly(U)-specific 3'-to-5' RNA exonuclease [Lobulomyces angularis]